MKRNKIMFVIAIVAILAVLFVACDEGAQPEHTHTYGAWSITTQPTETTAGSATRACACGDTETVQIANLSDTTVWTVDASQDATHTSKGFKVYKSAYGTVTVTLEKTTDHTYGAWTLTKNPTTTETGTAKRSCACGEEEEATVAVLTDTSVWTVTASQAATYTSKGFTTYQSEYGAFTLVYDQVAHEHRYSGYTTYREPTCTEDGVKIRYCYDCEYQDVVILPATGHKYTQYEPVEFEYGNGDYVYTYYQHSPKCEVCGYVNESKTENHTYDTTHIHVTESGVAYKVCNKCDYIDEEQSLGNISSWTVKETVAADYNQAGYTIYTKDTYEYRKEFAKLVAPYDGKTYYPLQLSISSNGTFSIGTSWGKARLTVDENGVGTGTAYPFSGTTTITMVNAETGEINWKFETSNYKGYVDFETGVIIRTRSGSFDDVLIMIPVDRDVTSSDILGSALGDGMAVSYTAQCDLHERHTFNFAISDEKVFFGVNFEGKDGNGLAADKIATSDYVKVLAEDGTKIVAFAKNAEGNFQETDGIEGAYTDANYGEVVLNGIGGATVGGEAGTYSYNEAGYYELYVGGKANATAYYTFTLTDGSIALTKPMTAITYVSAYGEDTIGDAYKSVNNNVKFTLPVLSNIAEAGANEFVGWTIEGQEGYVTEYTPAGADVTFTAVWKTVYVVSIIDGAEDVESVKVPKDETIYDYLPQWTEVGNREFVKWVVDSNGDGKYTEADDEDLDEELTATENITLIALWNIIPDYVGTYFGGELYNAGYGNSGGKTLTIDKQGNITGFRSGTVTAYDPATQKITWTNGTFYFDAEAKIILGIYDNNNIGNDYYFLGQNLASTGKVAANYGIYALKAGSTTDVECYAQFIEAKTALGDNTNIFTYGNKIYSDVELKDLNGNTLVVNKYESNSIAKAASVLVYKDGDLVFARVAGEGKSTLADSDKNAIPREIDAYYGTYTCEGQDSLVLDGTGEFAWGDKSGTYTVTNADTKTFDLYVVSGGKNVEYYTATLDGSTYTVEKPMVTVTYTTAITPVETLKASVQVNKNIEITLPALTNADNMFRGWLIADSATLYNGAYKPEANVDFTAKWDTKYSFKAVYNDGNTADFTKDYGAGDIVNIDTPVWAKHKFDGWFTTSSFDEESAWTTGSKITANLTIYAKWSDAEPWYNTYMPVEYSDTTTNGGVNSPVIRSTGKISVDADGKAAKSGWPFSYGDIAIAYTDKETGKITVTVGSSVYNGYLDKTTGVIVMSSVVGDTDFAKIYYLLPVESVGYYDVTCSYWDGGKTRVLSYTKGDVNYTAFINGGSVYFGTTFMDAAENGTAIAAENCYNAKSLFVFGSDGSEIAKFVYNGTTMVKPDGTEGAYTYDDMKLVLNGAGLIDIYGSNGKLSGTGTYAASGDSSYQYDVVLSDASYKLSIDKDTYTVTKYESNIVKITYMDGENIVKTEDVHKFIESDLWSEYKVDGYVLRGWYLDGDETQTLVTKYTATGNVTFVAKLDPAATLTIVYGNGLENKTYTFGKGDALDMSKYQPALTDGKAFSKWYTTADEGVTKVDFNATTITEDTTVYCEWVEAVASYGLYKGWEVWGSPSASSRQALAIDVFGKLSGQKTGTIVDYNDETGYCKIENDSDKYYAYYDKVNGIFVYAYSSNTDNFGTDAYYYFKGANTVTLDKANVITWNSSKTRLIPFVVDGVEKIIFINEDKVYCNVKVYDLADNEVAVTSALNDNGTAIAIKQGDTLIARYRYENGTFNVLESDGKAGTYTSDDAYGDIVLDGFGTLTVNGKNVSYTLDGDKVTFVVDNAMRVITLSGNTYTKTQDGYQGEYTLPDASKLTLDGYGNVTGTTKTYVVDGAQITIYGGEESENYGIDVDGKQFLGKSQFAGLTFSGTYYDEWDEINNKIEFRFDDASTITGILYVQNGRYQAKFTATFDGTKLTLTCTEDIAGSPGWAGKVLEATLSGDTFTITSWNGAKYGGLYSFTNKGSVTCKGFSL